MVDYIAGPTWMKKCQASSRDWLKDVWGNPHHSARTSIADIVAYPLPGPSKFDNLHIGGSLIDTQIHRYISVNCYSPMINGLTVSSNILQSKPAQTRHQKGQAGIHQELTGMSNYGLLQRILSMAISQLGYRLVYYSLIFHTFTVSSFRGITNPPQRC